MAVGQGKPREEKESKIRGKNPNPTHSHSPKSYKNAKLKIVTYMQRTWYRLVFRPLLAASVSMRSYDICSVVQRTLFSWGPLFPLTLTVLLPPLLQFPVRSGRKGRDLVETFHVRLCVPRFPSVAIGNVVDDG